MSRPVIAILRGIPPPEAVAVTEALCAAAPPRIALPPNAPARRARPEARA